MTTFLPTTQAAEEGKESMAIEDLLEDMPLARRASVEKARFALYVLDRDWQQVHAPAHSQAVLGRGQPSETTNIRPSRVDYIHIDLGWLRRAARRWEGGIPGRVLWQRSMICPVSGGSSEPIPWTSIGGRATPPMARLPPHYEAVLGRRDLSPSTLESENTRPSRVDYIHSGSAESTLTMQKTELTNLALDC